MSIYSVYRGLSWRLRSYDPSTDGHLPEYDHTALAGVNTCPVFGITRYVLHRTLAEAHGGGRHLALEAGSACHLAFAAERLYRLGWTMGLRSHADHHGRRIFGAEGWQKIIASVDGEDDRTDRLRMVIGGFDHSGYYDDPRDKRRTVSNIEEALTVYADSIDPARPIWVEDVDNPAGMVGIEIPFRLVIEFHPEGSPCRVYAFTGRIDGIEIDERYGVVPHDNKTTSRITESWESAWHLSHQLTGYLVAADHILSQLPTPSRLTRDANRGVRHWINGLSIPQPRTSGRGQHDNCYVRYPYHIGRWAHWFYTSARIIEKYQGNVLGAPMYTHSCNRYYTTCQFVPLCDADDDEREEILANMDVQRWSPLEEEEPV